MKLILGSTSKTRQYILKKLGFSFRILLTEFNEKKIRAKKPRELVLKLALAKTAAIKKIAPPKGILVTADQVAFANEKILEKPKNLKEAEKFLRSYSDNVVDNISAVVVTNLSSGKFASGVDNLKVTLKEFDEKLIKKALGRKNVLKLSGAVCFGDSFWQPYIKKLSGDKAIFYGIAIRLMRKLIKKVK